MTDPHTPQNDEGLKERFMCANCLTPEGEPDGLSDHCKVCIDGIDYKAYANHLVRYNGQLEAARDKAEQAHADLVAGLRGLERFDLFSGEVIHSPKGAFVRLDHIQILLKHGAESFWSSLTDEPTDALIEGTPPEDKND